MTRKPSPIPRGRGARQGTQRSGDETVRHSPPLDAAQEKRDVEVARVEGSSRVTVGGKGRL